MAGCFRYLCSADRPEGPPPYPEEDNGDLASRSWSQTGSIEKCMMMVNLGKDQTQSSAISEMLSNGMLPKQYKVEMSSELARERGLANGDGVVVERARGRVEAIAMVTVRMRPLTVQGSTIQIGMPLCFGWTTPGCGDGVNRLTPAMGDPNTTIPEFKAHGKDALEPHRSIKNAW